MKTNRKRKSTGARESRVRRNNLLYGGMDYNGKLNNKTEIRHTWYDHKQVHSEVVATLSTLHLQPGKVNWIQVCGLSDEDLVSKLCQNLGLSFLVIQDILNVRHIAKIEETGQHLFAVLNSYSLDMGILKSEYHSVVLGKDLVISFEEGDGRTYDPVRNTLQEGIGQVRQHGADFLFNLLISTKKPVDKFKISEKNLPE